MQMTKKLDTLAIVDELKGTGFNDEQSRAICATVHGGLVTKDEFNHRLDKMDMKIENEFKLLHSSITNINSSLNSSITNMKFTFGAIATVFGIIIALAKAGVLQ